MTTELNPDWLHFGGRQAVLEGSELETTQLEHGKLVRVQFLGSCTPLWVNK